MARTSVARFAGPRTAAFMDPLAPLRSLPIRLLAEATGAHPRTVERWRTRTGPQRRYRERIDELAAVFAILGDGMDAAAKRAWLESRNPFLEWRRPAELLAAGRFDEVRAAAESYMAGDFA